MILYSVVSTYQMLSAMVHKAHTHAGDKAVLMIASTLQTKFPHWEQLKSLFDDVWVYRLTPVSDDKVDEKTIAKYFDGFFAEHHTDAASFEKIYVGGAHYHLSIYLLSRQIPFIMMEDAAGVFSDPSVLVNTDRGMAPRRSAMARERQLYTGENPALQGLLGNRFAQKEPFDETNFEHQDAIEAFAELTAAQKTAIRSFFVPQDVIHVPENATVVLTQHFSNLKMLTFEGQVTIYQYLVDYFLQGRTVVIKPHPDDLLYYGKLFPGVTVIHQKFPSELLPVLFDHKPTALATVSSTSVGSLKRYFPSVLDMTPVYEKDFLMTHRYVAALRFLHAAGAKHLCCVGVNREIVRQLWPMIAGAGATADFPEEGGKVSGYVLANRAPKDGESVLKAVQQGGCAVFLDQDGDCAHFRADSASGMRFDPLVIRKTALRDEDMDSPMADETIWTAGAQDTAAAFRTEQVLTYSGMKWEVAPLTEQEREIQVLKGNLKAVETRLLAVLRRNEELEKQLKDAQK